MSFDHFWDLRWPEIDSARYARWVAAIETEVASHGGFPIEVLRAPGAVTCNLEVPRALVVQHDVGVEPISDAATFWITFTLDCGEDHPAVRNEPYERSQYDFGGGISSLRRAGDDLYVLTDDGECWQKRGKQWRPMGSRGGDEAQDDRRVDSLGVVGDAIALVTTQGVLDWHGKALAPAPPRSFANVLGAPNDLWAVDDDWQGYHSDGESWRRVGEEEGLGRLVRSRFGDFGLSLKESCIVRLERGAIVPYSAPLPEDVIGNWELAVTRDGACWMNGCASVFRWDGTEWREFVSRVGSPRALIADGDVVIQLGRGGEGARWDGAAMVPFVAAHPDDIRSAEVDPFGVVALDGWTELVELVPRGPFCYVHLASNTSANREAWGAATMLIEAIVARLGGSPGYFF